jgi:CRISPR-associated protein Cas4
MKISVTLLSSYLYCSRKLFLEKVMKLEEPPKESLVMGSIRHNTYDKINKEEESIVSSITNKMSFDEIQSMYKQKYLAFLKKSIADNRKRLDYVNLNAMDAYKKAYLFIAEESLTRASNIFSFIEKNNVFGDELWEKLTPKIISELRIESDSLKLKGIIDQVHVYDNEYVPIELKTGKMPHDGVWPSHRVQIAAYSLLLQEHFKKPVKEGFVRYLDTKQNRQIVMNPYMADEVKKLVDEVIALLESRELPDYCNNENKCRKCGLREKCYNEEEMSTLLKVKAV